MRELGRTMERLLCPRQIVETDKTDSAGGPGMPLVWVLLNRLLEHTQDFAAPTLVIQFEGSGYVGPS
jgi:hypothetical protein